MTTAGQHSSIWFQQSTWSKRQRKLELPGFLLLLIACMTFLLMNLVPGGPFLSEKAPSPEVLAAMEAKYGLDKPLVVRMGTWIADFAQGNTAEQRDCTAVGEFFGEVTPEGFQLVFGQILSIPGK